jgi:hypothetical protein
VLLNGREVKKIGMNNFAEFRVGSSAGFPVDDEHLFYVGMAQAFQQDAFSDHACRSGYDGCNSHGIKVMIILVKTIAVLSFYEFRVIG